MIYQLTEVASTASLNTLINPETESVRSGLVSDEQKRLDRETRDQRKKDPEPSIY